jgi:hypothetical protein
MNDRRGLSARAAEAPISGKSANTLQIGQANCSFAYAVFPSGGISPRSVTLRAHFVGCGGVAETPRVCPNRGQVRSMNHGTATGWRGDLLPATRPTKTFTQHGEPQTLGVGVLASAAIPGSATGLRGASVGAKASLAPPVSLASPTTRRHRPTSRLSFSRRPLNAHNRSIV